MAFPGSYKDAQQLMKVIAEELRGSLHSGYKPGDQCTTVAAVIDILSNDDGIDLTTDKIFLSKCKKYFPESIGVDNLVK